MNRTLKDLYFSQLNDIYDAELRMMDALPKMADRASNNELRGAFNEHLVDTEKQVSRLEGIFHRPNEKPERKPCKAMQGLIEEGEEAVDENGDEVVNDAHLIAQAQRIEHYEIAGYGTLKSFAKVLGFKEDFNELGDSLEEESDADSKLNRIADGGIFSSGVNQQAPANGA